MTAALAKLFLAALKPLKWAHSLFADETHIEWVLPQALDCDVGVAPIHVNESGQGELWFAIGSRSKLAVEIVRLELDYEAPLQLSDPEQRGFFAARCSNDPDFPFQLFWQGSAQVRRDLRQAFIVSIRFTDALRERGVRISVYAKRQRTGIRGFLTQGRLKVTSGRFRVKLHDGDIRGLALPPKCSLTSQQPYFIEGAVNAVGSGGLALVHEVDADGSVSSKQVILPKS